MSADILHIITQGESETLEFKSSFNKETDFYQASTRNKLLAEALYLTKDIEKYGSGFTRIRKAIEQYPTMVFNYKETSNAFITEFSYSQQKENTILNEPLNEKYNEILKCIAKKTNSQRGEIAQQLKLNTATVKRAIDYLLKSNLIERRGSKKNRGLLGKVK